MANYFFPVSVMQQLEGDNLRTVVADALSE